MEKKSVSVIVLMLLLVSILTLTFSIQPVKAEPKTIIVPDDYQTIQEAVNAAGEGDTIQVAAGTYGMANVDKSHLTLVGENRETILLGGFALRGAYNVTIRGFTINEGITLSLRDHMPSDMCRKISIIDNTLLRWILMKNSKENVIANNTITSAFAAIRLWNSWHITITGNIITNNSGNAIEEMVLSTGNIITNNMISNNGGKGIWQYISGYDTITGNTIFQNQYGIYLEGGSKNNIIHHNNFTDNANQVVIEGLCNNTWDDGYPSGGNYWSDYIAKGGYDADGDGIGDIPYVIDANNQDRYPLMEPWTPMLPVHNIDTGLHYATIQEAIDALETLDGHTILVDAGIYYEHVTIDKSVSLVGEDKHNTIIDGSGTGNVVLITADNVTISGFTVTNALLEGILVDVAQHCEVHDNIVCFTGDRGIVFDLGGNNTVYNNVVYNSSAYGGIEAIWSDNNTIYNNLAYFNQWGVATNHGSYNLIYNNTVYSNEEGIHIDWPSTGNNVYNNNISSNTLFGIHVLNQANENIIRDNEISQNNEVGIWLHSSSNNMISGNNANNNNYHGIFLYSSENNLISNNIASDNFEGISVQFSYGNKLEDNLAVSNSYCGIHLVESYNTIVQMNTASLNDEDGIVLHSSDNNKITENLVESNYRGITLVESDYNVVEANTCVDNTRWGIVVDGSEHNAIEENIAIRNQRGGIILYYSNYNKVEQNEATNNGEYGIILYGSDNNKIEENKAKENNHGIYLFASSSNIIEKNVAAKNRMYGIAVAQDEGINSNNNKIEQNRALTNEEFDLYWDMTGIGNIWEENKYKTENW